MGQLGSGVVSASSEIFASKAGKCRRWGVGREIVRAGKEMSGGKCPGGGNVLHSRRNAFQNFKTGKRQYH